MEQLSKIYLHVTIEKVYLTNCVYIYLKYKIEGTDTTNYFMCHSLDLKIQECIIIIIIVLKNNMVITEHVIP